VPHEIDFADTAIELLKVLTARERSTVIEAIEDQLSHEPLVETRNRKLLRPNPVATWELRVQALRVFCDVATTEGATVRSRWSAFSPSARSSGNSCASEARS
jgi:hypothetical protein